MNNLLDKVIIASTLDRQIIIGRCIASSETELLISSPKVIQEDFSKINLYDLPSVSDFGELSSEGNLRLELNNSELKFVCEAVDTYARKYAEAQFFEAASQVISGFNLPT